MLRVLAPGPLGARPWTVAGLPLLGEGGGARARVRIRFGGLWAGGDSGILGLGRRRGVCAGFGGLAGLEESACWMRCVAVRVIVVCCCLALTG